MMYGGETPSQEIYGTLDYALQVDEDPDVEVPPEMMPSTVKGRKAFLEELQTLYSYHQLWKQKYIEDLAWASHHMQLEQAENRYSIVRRVAGIMTEVELEEFLNEDKELSYIPSWAKAEIRFKPQFHEFNEYVKKNIANMVWRPPPGADDEEFDILDDVLLLTGNIHEEEQDQQEDKSLELDTYLTGVLPGADVDPLSSNYLEEIYPGPSDDEPSSDDMDDDDMMK